MTARRGDLVVIERKTSYVTTSSGWHEQMEYEVGVVTSITRDGIVKAFRDAAYGSDRPIANLFGFQRSWIIPAGEVDVAGAICAAAANEWSAGKPGKPFDSLDEVKACVAPFKASAAVRNC